MSPASSVRRCPFTARHGGADALPYVLRHFRANNWLLEVAMAKIERLIPVLVYDDITAAHDFLVNAFGLLRNSFNNLSAQMM